MPGHYNNKQHTQKHYYKQIQARLCIRCTLPAVEDILSCQYHRDKERVYQKQRKEKRKAANLCTICKEPARRTFNGRFMCNRHIVKVRNAARVKYKTNKDNGICIDCKQPANPGKVKCEYHRIKQNEYQGRRLQELTLNKNNN